MFRLLENEILRTFEPEKERGRLSEIRAEETYKGWRFLFS
jgi:hypothetical protein